MRLFRTACIAALTFTLPTIAACDGDDATGPGTDTVQDTLFVPDSTGDTVPVDTTVPDTTPADTTVPDTTQADTAPADTAPADTTPADTAPADTTPADTTPADTTPTEVDVVQPEGASNQIKALVDALANATGPVSLNVLVDDATVTMTKPAFGPEAAGFFIQGEQAGPAIFVRLADATTVVRNDFVTLRATTIEVVAGVAMITTYTGLEVQSGAGDADRFIQDVSGADLVGGYAGLANEHVSFEAEIVSDFTFAGEGFASAQIVTDGVPTASENLKLRLPQTLVDQLVIGSGCLVEVSRGVIWRFVSSSGTFAQTQPSVYEDWDIVAVCNGPTLQSAAAASATKVVLNFDKAVDPASITNAATQFTISNGLTVSAASVIGKSVELTTTSAQTPNTTYVVTIANTVTDLADRPVIATAQAGTFTGFAGLASLLVSEVDYNQPGDDVNEYVEIHNAGASAVDLSAFKLEMINGGDAAAPVVYATHALSGSLPAGGYFVLASGTVTVDPGAVVARFGGAKDQIQNGARDGVRIVTAAGGVVVDALLYQTPVDTVGAILSYAEGAPMVDGENNSEPNQSVARCPNGADTNNNATDFKLSATPTPGKANVCP